jgi:hypothetical protein
MFYPAADSLVSNDCAEQEEIAQMAHVDAQVGPQSSLQARIDTLPTALAWERNQTPARVLPLRGRAVRKRGLNVLKARDILLKVRRYLLASLENERLVYSPLIEAGAHYCQ